MYTRVNIFWVSSVISPVLRTTSIIGWGSIIIIQNSMLVVTTNPSSLPSRARCAWCQTWMQHFHCPFKQAQHFEINRDIYLAYNLLWLPTNDEKHKSRFMRHYLFSSLFSVTDSKCEFQAAPCLLKPHGGKVWRNFYLAARLLACLGMCPFCLPSRNKEGGLLLWKIFYKEWSQVLCWGTRGYGAAGTHWLTAVIWADVEAWRGLRHCEIRLVSAGLPKCLDPPLFFLGLHCYSLLLRQKEKRDAREVFILPSCISSCNLTPVNLLFAYGPSLPPPLFFFFFLLSTLHSPLPVCLRAHHPSSRLTWAQLSVPVLHQTLRGAIQ